MLIKKQSNKTQIQTHAVYKQTTNYTYQDEHR